MQEKKTVNSFEFKEALLGKVRLEILSDANCQSYMEAGEVETHFSFIVQISQG